MKILITANRFPAASEPFVIEQAIALIQLGHDVSISAPLNMFETDQTVSEKVLEFGLERHFTPLYLNADARFPLRWFALPTILNNYRKVVIGHPSQAISVLQEGSQSLLRAMPRGADTVDLGSFDVVHSHFGTSARRTLGLILAGKIRTRVFVPNFHGNDLITFGSHTRAAYRTLFRRADAVISNSEYTRGLLENIDCPAEKLNVIPVGINVDDWQVNQHPPTESEPLRMLSVGRLIPWKGHINAIKAIEQLGREVNLEYSIIGEGPIKDELIEYCSSHDLLDRVKFLGALPHGEVKRHMSSTHVFIHPSTIDERGREENLGVVVREAAACGVPSIATRTGGIPENMVEGVTGILVPPEDPGAIADAVREMVRRREEWPQMSAAARKLAVEQFDNKRLFSRQIELFESL